MIGMGTIVNVLAILVGGLIGLLVKGGLKQHYQEGVIHALGLATMFIGAGSALCGMLVVSDGALSSAGTRDTIHQNHTAGKDHCHCTYKFVSRYTIRSWHIRFLFAKDQERE